MVPVAFLRVVLVILTGVGLIWSGGLGAIAQGEISARVTGTGGDGLILRAEASRASAQLGVIPEGAVVTVIGPEQFNDSRSWRPVRDGGGQVGWLASEFLSLELMVAAPAVGANVESEVPEPAPTRTPIPRAVATRQPDPSESVVEAPPTPGPPVSLEIRFKNPELDRRDRQVMTVIVHRNEVPVQDAIVRFIVDDEDPEVEREASPTNEQGRSVHEWAVRRYRGTTTVRVSAEAPDGGTGKTSRSFFVK